MKRILSAVLAVTLLLALCLTPAAGAEPEQLYHGSDDMALAESYADILYQLGLFKGTEKGYELDRNLTRIEAVIMLVRLLGKEEEAMAQNYSHPFTDLPSWPGASECVGYAWTFGLTKGTDPDKGIFDPAATATGQQYLTFILRALGYDDSDVDTDLYSEAFSFAQSKGELLETDWDSYGLYLRNFWRADAVDLSLRALVAETVLKEGGTLMDKLCEEGVFAAAEPVGIHHAQITVKDYGTITVALDGNVAPIAVSNFISLARAGFYDGLTFHRIIDGFMLQGGAPKGDGTGGSGTTIKGEFWANGIWNNISHIKGTLSMARADDPDSASSQFFITVADVPLLDGYYAAFGRVTQGQEILDKIAADAEPIDDNGTIPAQAQPVITSIVILD